MYWKYFNKYSDYVKRLGYILTKGIHSCPLAVYYPITTHYEAVDPCSIEKSRLLDRRLTEVCLKLSERQLDYDFINDDVISTSVIEASKIKIMNEEYKAVIFAGVSNIKDETAGKILDFLNFGGMALFCGKNELTNHEGIITEAIKNMMTHKNTVLLRDFTLEKRDTSEIDSEKLAQALYRFDIWDVKLKYPNCNIKYLKRQTDFGNLYFFINESRHKQEIETEFLDEGYIYEINLYNGEMNYICEYTGVLKLNFENYGERLIFISNEKIADIKNKPNLKIDRSELLFLNNWQISLNGKKISDTGLDDWFSLGFGLVSARAEYKTSFEIEKIWDNVMLDLGEVCCTAEVYLNGEHISDLIWEPYTADITPYITAGKNKLEIIVCNTNGQQFENRHYKSGLIGPVKIINNKYGEK